MRETKCFVFRFADVEVREREFTVTQAGNPISLEPKVFRVLQFLLHHPQRLCTKAELLDAVWTGVAVTENSLARAVAQLRRVLGDDIREPRFIATVTTAGYRFVCPVEALEDGVADLNGSSVPANQNGSEFAVAESTSMGAELAPISGTEDLREVANLNRKSDEQAGRRRAQRRRMLLAAFASSAVIIAVLAGWRGWPFRYTAHPKLTHIASNLTCGVRWSPDGRAFAYSKYVDGLEQLFVRYLNSPVDMQLTHEPHQIFALGWLPDGAHILFFESEDEFESGRWKLFSVAAVGGEAELIMPWTGAQMDISPDGKALAIVTKDVHGDYGVQVFDPIGSPPKWYLPDPFKTKAFSGRPGLEFMPDGKALLLSYQDEKSGFHFWSLPYPAGTGLPQPSRLTVPKDPLFVWSWMPDRRHMVTSWAEEEGSPAHLWMWDTESQERIPLTTGASDDLLPRVAPDGSKLVFAQVNNQFSLTRLSLADGAATTLLSTGRQESMASWSSRSGKLAWVSNQNGPYEIWVREPDGTQRPAIKTSDFPPGTNKGFMNPAIAPDGDRIIYEKQDSSSTPRLWISSLRGGVPVRLTNAQGSNPEWGGAWSPDGQRFVYLESNADKAELMIVKTTGNATPTGIFQLTNWDALPDWSPTGDWIAFQNTDGWHLISPDGKSTKFLGKIATEYLAFSKNGSLLYGIEEDTKTNPHTLTLFSLNPLTLKIRNIKTVDDSFAPYSPFGPGVRFSISPDGKSLVYSTYKGQSDLWLMDGLPQPDWLSRLRASLIAEVGTYSIQINRDIAKMIGKTPILTSQ